MSKVEEKVLSTRDKLIQDLGVRASSPTIARQYVNTACMDANDPDAKAVKMLKELTGKDHSFDKPNLARLTLVCLVEKIIADPAEYDSGPEAAFDAAQMRAHAFLGKPDASWMYAKKIYATSGPTTQAVVTTKSDVQVAVKQDGSMKKGGKQTIAEDLFKKHVQVDGGEKIDRQAFISMLVKELKMTKAGATTYAYNCQTKLGRPAKWEGKKKAAAAPVVVEQKPTPAPVATKAAPAPVKGHKMSKKVKRKK